MNIHNLGAAQEEEVRWPVVKGQMVRLASETARIAVPSAGLPAEPKIDVIRQGDIVQAIDITCSCGRCIRLRCIPA